MIDKDEVVTFLSSLSDANLVDVFYKSTHSRRQDKKYENGDFQIDDAFVIGIASYGSYEGRNDDEAEVELLSLPVNFESNGNGNVDIEGQVLNLEWGYKGIQRDIEQRDIEGQVLNLAKGYRGSSLES